MNNYFLLKAKQRLLSKNMHVFILKGYQLLS